MGDGILRPLLILVGTSQCGYRERSVLKTQPKNGGKQHRGKSELSGADNEGRGRRTDRRKGTRHPVLLQCVGGVGVGGAACRRPFAPPTPRQLGQRREGSRKQDVFPCPAIHRGVLESRRPAWLGRSPFAFLHVASHFLSISDLRIRSTQHLRAVHSISEQRNAILNP
jgi:hypothetical protein